MTWARFDPPSCPSGTTCSLPCKHSSIVGRSSISGLTVLVRVLLLTRSRRHDPGLGGLVLCLQVSFAEGLSETHLGALGFLVEMFGQTSGHGLDSQASPGAQNISYSG